VVWDDDLRGAILATGYAWRVRDTATQIEMVLVPSGTFQMGCSPSTAHGCDGDENPVHDVNLTHAFYMSRCEVTQAQWQARMGSNPSYFHSASSQVPADQVPNRPVERVSWTTVQDFLAQTGMRLPTEAEWEYAYRAGTTTAFHGFTGYPSGTNDDSLVGDIAWYSANSNGQTHPVSKALANGFGLYDMSGNVWEWVYDCYGSYTPGSQTDPTGPTGSCPSRALRGGSYSDSTVSLRSSSRDSFTPSSSDADIGFRVARDLPAPTLTSIGSPAAGPTSGGTLITLTGTNLSAATSVTVGGVAATSVQVVNAQTVTAITPAGSAGACAVSVTTPGGTATLPNAYRYVLVPSWATLIDALPDPAVVWDNALQAEILASGFAWHVMDTATQIEMMLIPPGTFQMGCSAPSDDPNYCESSLAQSENPVHTVTLTHPFYMGRYEVTQAQWQAQMGSNPSYWAPPHALPDIQRPVESVSWVTVQGFLAQTGMRLPTEAEWEYACRAGTTTAFHGCTVFPNGTNDDSLVGNIAWYYLGEGSCTSITPCRPRAVGGKLANGYGLYDMSGNVSEWVNDWYGPYTEAHQTNPTGSASPPASGEYRVIRGGSWVATEDNIRSSYRNYIGGPYYNMKNFDLGFRVARDAGTTLTSVSPAYGLTTGGTLITLTGTDLSGATSVTIGGVAATNVQVFDGTTVTAITPPGTAGVCSVSVTTPYGTATLPTGFVYVNEPQVPSWATLVEPLPDPAVVWDNALQNEILASGFAWHVKDTNTQIEMMLIPPGTFQMGCSPSNLYACEECEYPVHTVTLTNAFYMGRYEVTQAQWQAQMGSNPSHFHNASKQVPAAQVPNRPVEMVSWNTIQGYLAQTGMRLPTEAEWEYAYRAGTTTAFHGFTGFDGLYLNGTNDSTLAGNIAWDGWNAHYQTHPVGGKLANGFGLHDMTGNVWEWVSDWFGPYPSNPQVNPTGPANGSNRLKRSSGWQFHAIIGSSSHRTPWGGDSPEPFFGFRVARNP
jgi:formylglycine-generating enzyme required for sulfatase activity